MHACRSTLEDPTGAVKLIDFGVAKATQQMSAATEIGQVKGKFAYMSPEQIQGEPLDGRADLFAMGVVLYRTTTGVHPYKGDHPATTVRNILLSTPTLPSAILPSYPKALEQVVMKALSRDRADRFSSAEEMGAALDRALPLAIRANGARETDTFLRKNFGIRITERSQALRAAIAAADRGRPPADGKLLLSGFPRSQSTMRAVSIDSDGPEIIIDETDAGRTPHRGRLRRRMTAGSLALVAGLATWLVSRPNLPHFRFTRHVATASQPVNAPAAPTVPAPSGGPRPAEKTVPVDKVQAAEVPAAKAMKDPAPVAAQSAPVPPPPVRAPPKKRDKVRRTEAPPAPAEPHAQDADPLSRQQ